jgi:hypothetical protein
MTFLGVTTPYYGGGQVANPANVILPTSAPSANLKVKLGTLAVVNSTGTIYGAASLVGGVTTWAVLGGGTGAVATLTGDTGTATPVAGNVKIAGTTNQITTTGSAAQIALTIPSTFIAPGSIASTTTLTGGTGITATTGNISATAGAVNAGTSMTATLGNITATNGNFVASTAGTGLLFNPATTSGTTTSTLNGRVGQITITTPSIAAGATFAMTITNSSITGSGTQVGYWLTGGTTGAALTIQSYANTASQSVVTIQNGTGATTNTASLILNFLVLN